MTATAAPGGPLGTGYAPAPERAATWGLRGHRRAAFALVVVSIVSAALTAAVDASTISSRLAGDRLSGRPLWLHGFSIAIVTAVVGLVALLSTRPPLRLRRAIYVATAVLNATVPLLQLRQPETGWALPVLHAVAAGLLVWLAIPHHDARAHPHPWPGP